MKHSSIVEPQKAHNTSIVPENGIIQSSISLTQSDIEASKATPYTVAADTKVTFKNSYGEEHERKIWHGECSLDNVEYKTKPSGKDAARITNSIGGNRTAVTEDELIDAIVFHGRSWSPSIFSGDKRRTETFIGINAFVLDFDKGFNSLDEILERAEANKLKFSFVHESFNHSPERPKYRGVILLRNLLEDIGDAKIYLHYLKEVFAGFVDNAAAEPTRFFYGGKGLVIHNPRHYYTTQQFQMDLIGADKYFEILNHLSHKGEYVVRNDRVSLDFDDFESLENFFNDDRCTIAHDEKERLLRKISNAARRIASMNRENKLSRYECLYNACVSLGSESQIPEALSYQVLLEAGLSNPYYAKHWDRDLETKIQEFITIGRKIAS